MSLEENKTVVRRYFEEVMLQGNFEVYDTYFDPSLVYHFPNTPPHNRASHRKLVQQVHQAFSSSSFTIHDLIAEGDTVAARLTYASTKYHDHFGKNPPTGQPFQTEGIYLFHFKQGKVTEVWVYTEETGFDHTPE